MDLGQVFTNKNVAEYMVSLFNLEKTDTILDPCFGEGVFLEACFHHGYNNLSGYELDENLYKKVYSKYLTLDLHNADFLSVDSHKEYDGIIMNPPYIRQEKIDNLKPYGITKDILREKNIFEKLPKTANLYMYFIFKAIDLLKPEGQLVAIFPSSWLQARSGRAFEKMLYSQCTLKQQIHIAGDVFEKEALVDVVILNLVKGNVAIESEIKNLKISNGQFVDKGFCTVEDELCFSASFSKYAQVRRGLTTGFNAMFINPVFKNSLSKDMLIPIISSPKAIKGYTTKCAEADMLLSVHKEDELNDEIRDYFSYWGGKILQEASPKTLYKKIQQGGHWYSVKPIDSHGILFSYFVRNDMKFIENDSGILARDNFYIIYPKINKRLLFALLNNYYTYYQLEKSGKKYGAGLLKLQRYDMEYLKFPDIDLLSKLDQEKICMLADKLSSKGDATLVRMITKIISSYSNMSYEEITNQYREIKKQRLEGCANGN